MFGENGAEGDSAERSVAVAGGEQTRGEERSGTERRGGRGCRDVVRRGCTGWDLICVPFHAQPSGTFLPHFAARLAFAPHRRVD